jgi:hypothetical protein
VNVYCRDHGRSMGVVDRTPGGFPLFHTRSPRWRNRNAAELGHPDERSNSWTDLREWTQPEVRTWCRDCDGDGSRYLRVADLLEAFEAGRPKIYL